MAESLRWASKWLYITGFIQNGKAKGYSNKRFLMTCLGMTMFGLASVAESIRHPKKVMATYYALFVLAILPKLFVPIGGKHFYDLLDSIKRIHGMCMIEDGGPNIVKSFDRIAVIMSKFITTGYFSFTPMFILFSIKEYVATGKELPPMDVWTPDMHIFLIWLYHLFIMLGPVLVNTVFYTTFVTATLLICAYISVLRHMLENLPEKNPRLYLKRCFKLHQEIIRCVGLINKSLSSVIAVEVLVSSMYICLGGYEILKGSEDLDSKRAPVFFVMVVTISLPFTVCQCGQVIVNQGELLYRSAYAGNWYKQDTKTRKDLVLLMTMSTRILRLHFRNTLKFDLERFSAVLSASYSYITLLRNADI